MDESSFPAGAGSRFIDLGGPVHYLEYSGPASASTVVCLHGLGGSAVNFAAVGPLLADRFRVVAVDLLGHGRTHADCNGAGAVEANLQLVRRFCREVADGPVILMGHSLGGVLALLHTMDDPADVDRLVLLGPPVPSRARRSRDPKLTAKMAFLRAPGVGRMVARQMAKMAPEELVLKQLKDATPHVANIPDGVVAESVAEVADRRAGSDAAEAQEVQWEAILDTIALLARPDAWRQRVALVDKPALWLQGDDDLMVSPADAAALAGTRPDWQFESRPGVGHLPHLEDPSWTAERVLTWTAHS
jgi:pimeloyl-ACP methyl ester carboxylesterase